MDYIPFGSKTLHEVESQPKQRESQEAGALTSKKVVVISFKLQIVFITVRHNTLLITGINVLILKATNRYKGRLSKRQS